MRLVSCFSIPTLFGPDRGILACGLAISAVNDGFEWLTFFSVTSLLGYAALASLLTWHALRRFDVVAGRARRQNAKTQREVPGTDQPDRGSLTTCPSA